MIAESCEEYWKKGMPVEKKFQMEIKWSKTKRNEYCDFKEGNVQTGEELETWVGLRIHLLNKQFLGL